MIPKGFQFKNRTIYYIEQCGKDCGFDRWRVHLYYAPHYAETHFFSNEFEYDKFISDHAKDCYSDYEVFGSERRCLDTIGFRYKDSVEIAIDEVCHALAEVFKC